MTFTLHFDNDTKDDMYGKNTDDDDDDDVCFE